MAYSPALIASGPISYLQEMALRHGLSVETQNSWRGCTAHFKNDGSKLVKISSHWLEPGESLTLDLSVNALSLDSFPEIESFNNGLG